MKKMGMKKMVGARKRGAAAPKAMKAPKATKMPDMGGSMTPMPPMAGPMPQGMKKGGSVKKMAKGGMAKPGKAPKGGLGIMIILGKKKGK